MKVLNILFLTVLTACGGGSPSRSLENPQPIPPRQVSVSCMGDSETAGYTPTGLSLANSWCNNLSVLNVARFSFINNYAIPSQDITQISVSQLPKTLERPTDLVFVMSGANDAYHKVPLEVYKQKYQVLIDLLNAKGSKVIILTALPTHDPDIDVVPYNNAAKALTGNVVVIDTYAKATPSWWGEWYLKDIHPTKEGYLEITKIILNTYL